MAGGRGKGPTSVRSSSGSLGACPANHRCRYWDWSQDDSAIPNILMRPTVTVTRPGASGGQPQQTNIPNPLYQYRFTNGGLRARYFDGLQAEAQITLRQPVDVRTSDDAEADSEMRANYDARRSNTYNLFSIPDFSAFSSSAFQTGDSPNAWVSVESIHNQIHASIGGSNDPLSGHMSFVDYSAFDPIFWLHHANVDRLTAMYQAARPGARLTPQPATGVFGRRVQEGDTDDINTPLWPFRKASGSYFTSRDVNSASSIWDFGYAYPEVPSSYRGRPASELRTFVVGRINALYAPGSVNSRLKRADVTTRREWICHFVFTPADVGGTAELAIYFNGTDGYAVGAGAALGKVRYTAMDKKMRVTAAVPLTDALEREGIDVNDPKAVVGYLRSNIDWVMRKVRPPPILPPCPHTTNTASTTGQEKPLRPFQDPVAQGRCVVVARHLPRLQRTARVDRVRDVLRDHREEALRHGVQGQRHGRQQGRQALLWQHPRGPQRLQVSGYIMGIHERCFSFFGFGYRRGFSVCFALLRSDLRLVVLRAFMRVFFLSFFPSFGDFPLFYTGVFFCSFMSLRLSLLGEGGRWRFGGGWQRW